MTNQASRKAPSGVVMANHVGLATSDAKPASGMLIGEKRGIACDRYVRGCNCV